MNRFLINKFLCVFGAIFLLFSMGYAQKHNNRDDVAYPVTLPKVVDYDTHAEITWGEPAGGIPAVFRFDSNSASGQLGFTGESPRGVVGSCHRVSAELDKIQWYLTNHPQIPATHVNIYIFDLDEAGLPTNNILFSALNVPTTVMQWCEYVFPASVPTPNGFYMALSRPSGSNLALGTSAPTEEWPFQPNTHYYNPDYENSNFIVVVPNVYNINFMIRAEGYTSGKSAQFGYSKALTNYRIYRLLDGEQNNETVWTALATNVTGLSYTDNGWNTAEEGFYRWAVKAEYTEEELSVPRFTNMLTKGKEFPYTVNLSTNSGDPVTGAIVTLTNQDEEIEHVYSQTATETSVDFQKIWKGTYTVSVTLKGFHLYTATNIVVDAQNLFHNVELEEMIYPVVNPVAKIVDNYAVITWEEPAYKEWLKYCVNDEIALTIGWSEAAGNDMTAAMRFTPSDLNAQGIVSGYMITKMALGLGTQLDKINTMEIRIWEGGTSVNNPGTLVYLQAITNFSSFTEVAINEINLTTPYIIDATKELRIGYRLVNTAGFPFGADAGPNVSQKGGLFYCPILNSGQWIDIRPMFNWNCNWVLKALVSSEDKSVEKFLTSNSENEDSKSVVSFSVFRLKEGQPESQWTMLDENVSELTYTDKDWGAFSSGAYQWAVKANYPSGQSGAKLTNVLTYQKPLYKVSFIVVDSETQTPVTNAAITFNGVPLSGYIVENVESGTYNYSVSKENYTTVTEEVTIVNEDVIEVVHLTALSINDYNFVNIQVYPNPFSNEIYISQPNLVKSIQVTDILGQQKKNVIFNGKSILVEELSNGIYFITIESFAGEKLIRKVVKAGT